MTKTKRNTTAGGRTLGEWFDEALPWPAYLDAVVKNRELWHAVHDRVRLPEDLEAVVPLSTPGAVRLLALSADWCGDAVNVLPVIARVAERLGIDFRVLDRDENLDLMDRYLTDGRSRSIPVVVVLDADFAEVGWWGPRPSELQAWVVDEGRQLSSPDRYKVVRRWYARDQGRTTVHELGDIVAKAG